MSLSDRFGLAQCIARDGADRGNYAGLWDYNIVPTQYVIDPQKIATTR